MFFGLAALGRIVKNGLGVAQRCLACYLAKNPTAEPRCTGFEPVPAMERLLV